MGNGKPLAVSFSAAAEGLRGPAEGGGSDLREVCSVAEVRDDTALVEQVVVQLNRLCRDTTLEFAMSVGKLIIDAVYGGDLGAWRARGVKNFSFRKLARHPDLPMSPSSLYRSVAMYELVRRLGLGRLRYVSTSHLRVVLPLPGDVQAQLVRLAEEGEWSVERLREEIASGNVKPARAGSRGGPGHGSRLRKTILLLQKHVESSNRLLSGCDEEEMSPDTARSVIDLSQRLQQACALLEVCARRYMPGARTDPPPALGPGYP